MRPTRAGCTAALSSSMSPPTRQRCNRRNSNSLRIRKRTCPSITDKGLETISKLSQLKSLELRGTKISDEGIKEIAKLEHLEDLSLEDADVGDKGISYLKPLG